MHIRLIDSHAHLNFAQFAVDREAVIDRARQAGIGFINVGTDLVTSAESVALAEKNPGLIWSTVGIHPTDVVTLDDLDKAMEELRRLAGAASVVGIGECGLDYARVTDLVLRGKQKDLFSRQIELALNLNKALMIHCREAYSDVLEILNSYHKIHGRRLRGNVHFFAGDWSVAQQFLQLGFTLSFTGAITFPSKAGQVAIDPSEVIQRLPLGSFLVETDCPFVAPVPHRGKRNEPLFVLEVIKKIAALRGESEESIIKNTLETTRRVFEI